MMIMTLLLESGCEPLNSENESWKGWDIEATEPISYLKTFGYALSIWPAPRKQYLPQ